jgi:hypothetical protein
MSTRTSTLVTALILVIARFLPPAATAADPPLARPRAPGLSGGLIEVTGTNGTTIDVQR